MEREIFDDNLGLWLTSSIYPTQLKSPDGHAIYFHTVYDITARKNAEEKLKKKQEEVLQLNKTLDQRVNQRTKDIENLLKQKDEFLHILAHDLKNPLSTPLNLLPILEEKIIDEKQRKMIHACNKSVKTIKNLILEIMQLCLANDTSIDLQHTDISLRNVIQTAIEKNQVLFDQNDFIVENKVTNHYMVSANRFQIEELLSNLFFKCHKIHAKK